MENMINLTIDGVQVSVPAGSTVLEAARAANIHIPTLCYLKDVNQIDSYHLEAYGEPAVNYNRDMEVFPVVKRIIEKITGKESEYKSPTDMGVNRAKAGIINDEVCRYAAVQEIIRRYLIAEVDYKKGKISEETLERSQLLMDDVGALPEDRQCVLPARAKVEEKRALDKKRYENVVAMAIEMPDGHIVTGRSSRRMVAAAAAILNGIKYLAGMDDDTMLIAPDVLQSIQRLNTEALSSDKTSRQCGDIRFLY